MLIRRLRLEAIRRFERAEIELQPGFNLITGDNGSGKTTLLEALHLLAHGRSFRGRVRDGLVRQGEAALQVYVEWETHAGASRRVGLRHGGNAWQARLDGQEIRQLGTLCEALAVVTFEPGSHALVDGGGDVRRRYLDWGMFHVEHGFMPEWRRYARALKQRNSGIAINHQAVIPLERQYRRTRSSPHQPIGGAGVVAKLIELLLNGTYRLIRSRTRLCWCRQGTRGWAASESAPAFCLKLAPVRLNVSLGTIQIIAPSIVSLILK